MNQEKAIATIAVERVRQVKFEGWDEEHDDVHEDGELLAAANFYYLFTVHPGELTLKPSGVPQGWIWEDEWWKPKDRERNLVRAGALCMAERDRIRRQKVEALRKLGRRDLISDFGTDWGPEHVKQKFDLIVFALESEPETATA